MWFLYVIFVLMIVLPVGFMIYCLYDYIRVKRNNKRKALIEYLKKKKMREEEDKSVSFAKENNLEGYPINTDFLKKYGISLLAFKSQFNANALSTGSMTGAYTQYKVYLFKVMDRTKLFLLKLDSDSKLYKFFNFEYWNEEMKQNYLSLSLQDLDSVIYDYDVLEFVEYKENIDTHSYSFESKPSSLGLAVHEELFGTASAINKANQKPVVSTFTYNDSYITFNFKEDSNIPVLRYMLKPTEQKGEAYYFGILKEIWVSKNIKAVTAKSLVNSNSSKRNNMEVLKEIKEMYEAGLITQEEYELKKKDILSKM